MIYKRHSLMISLLIPLLLITGCGKKKPAPAGPLTIEQQRQQYIQQLRAADAQFIKIGEDINIVLPSNQLFIFKSAKINPDYQATLMTAAKLVATYDKINVKVQAYLDRAGKRLTTHQAQAVAKVLWRKGIDARLLTAKGLSNRHPVARNSTIDGAYQNSRVEIRFRYYPDQVRA